MSHKMEKNKMPWQIYQSYYTVTKILREEANINVFRNTNILTSNQARDSRVTT